MTVHDVYQHNELFFVVVVDSGLDLDMADMWQIINIA